MVTIWPELDTYDCAGFELIVTVKLPFGVEPFVSTAFALPVSAAAIIHATTCVPGLTAVTAHSNRLVWPGASGPSAQVFEYAVTPAPAPPD